MAFTKEQAKASDRRLAELTAAYWAATDRLTDAVDALHRAAGERARTGARAWALTEAQAREQAQRIAADDGQPRWVRDRAAAAPGRVDEARSARDAADDAVRAHEVQWRDNGRWSRFFVVQGGHIHQSPGCHSLRPTTRLGWLPELSGESEADAVAAHGPTLCTHCFKSAPVEWTTQHQVIDPLACLGGSVVSGSFRRRMHGGIGVCGECGQLVTVTSTGKVRKHKKQQEDGAVAS